MRRLVVAVLRDVFVRLIDEKSGDVFADRELCAATIVDPRLQRCLTCCLIFTCRETFIETFVETFTDSESFNENFTTS